MEKDNKIGDLKVDSKITCIDCGQELTENTTGPENDNDVHYTYTGNGPYCYGDYLYAQAREDFPHENELIFG